MLVALASMLVKECFVKSSSRIKYKESVLTGDLI